MGRKFFVVVHDVLFSIVYFQIYVTGKKKMRTRNGSHYLQITYR